MSNRNSFLAAFLFSVSMFVNAAPVRDSLSQTYVPGSTPIYLIDYGVQVDGEYVSTGGASILMGNLVEIKTGANIGKDEYVVRIAAKETGRSPEYGEYLLVEFMSAEISSGEKTVLVDSALGVALDGTEASLKLSKDKDVRITLSAMKYYATKRNKPQAAH